MEKLTTKKRIQFTIDRGTAESAEYIIEKSGLSPANIVSMMYAEIANTGKIPISLKATDQDFVKAKIIKASYDLPTEKINTPEKAKAFLNDDGGY